MCLTDTDGKTPTGFKKTGLGKGISNFLISSLFSFLREGISVPVQWSLHRLLPLWFLIWIRVLQYYH